MIHTRYTPTNIVLLVLGVGLEGWILFMTIMTAGFGTDPIHDLRSGAIVVCLLLSLSSAGAFLAMFRWCNVGSTAMWAIAAACFIAGLFGSVMFAVFLFPQALICQGISEISERGTSATGQS